MPIKTPEKINISYNRHSEKRSPPYNAYKNHKIKTIWPSEIRLSGVPPIMLIKTPENII